MDQTLLTAYANMVDNSYVRNRVYACLTMEAWGIVTEDPQTVNHAMRLTWAKGAFKAPDATIEVATRMVMAAVFTDVMLVQAGGSPTLDGAMGGDEGQPTDAYIQARVAQVVNVLAV